MKNKQIILESLIRACLKLIPMGPFLEQLSFGTKEAIKNERTNESIERIQNKLSSYTNSILPFEQTHPELENSMNQFNDYQVRNYKGPKIQYRAIKDIKRP